MISGRILPDWNVKKSDTKSKAAIDAGRILPDWNVKVYCNTLEAVNPR